MEITAHPIQQSVSTTLNDLEVTIHDRYVSEEQTHLIYLVSYEEERTLPETLECLCPRVITTSCFLG